MPVNTVSIFVISNLLWPDHHNLMTTTSLKPCPTCKYPVNGETTCPHCRTLLLTPDHPGYYIPGYKGKTETFTPPISKLDDAKPTPGPMSETYRVWIGRHVKLQETGQTGWVFGVDPCPMTHPGAIHPEHVESGYLHVKLDQPTGADNRTFALPEKVEIIA